MRDPRTGFVYTPLDDGNYRVEAPDGVTGIFALERDAMAAVYISGDAVDADYHMLQWARDVGRKTPSEHN
jgi:hypothetical protein